MWQATSSRVLRDRRQDSKYRILRYAQNDNVKWQYATGYEAASASRRLLS